jgi:hypothetical protein
LPAARRRLADLLKRPAARLTRADAVNALDKLVRAGKPTMAGRTLAYARAAFRWAEKRGKVPSNPFHGLPIATGSTARERVLSDAELAEVWAAAGTLGYPFASFFKLAMLTMLSCRLPLLSRSGIWPYSATSRTSLCNSGGKDVLSKLEHSRIGWNR